jgi:NhaA family Na+:H+ antiporter
VRFSHLVGVGLLGGIGFTMSIFIGELAFAPAPALLLHAKIGILLASLIAGIAGYLWLRATTRRGPPSAARSSLGSDAAL